MKVKVTTTLTYEMDLDLSDYEDEETPPKTEDEILAFERKQAQDEPADSYVLDQLRWYGKCSDIKIEKVEEKAEAAA